MMRVVVVAALLVVSEGAMPKRREKKVTCATECAASDCKDALTMKWGKWCGVGHTGCITQEEKKGVYEKTLAEPCDAYDRCCMHHDECVGKKGMMNTDCHTDLKDCLKKAIDKKEGTWSDKCKAEDLVQTMTQGMDLANLFSNSFKQNKDERNVKKKGSKKKGDKNKPAYSDQKQKKPAEKPTEPQGIKQQVETAVKEKVARDLRAELEEQEALLDEHMDKVQHHRTNVKELKTKLKQFQPEEL